MFAAQCVFITGGAVGIGHGLAQEFANRGAKVIIGGRREAALKAAAAKTPGLTYVVVDVADPASVADAARRIGDLHPDLDCVINNAGVQRRFAFDGSEPVSMEALREEIDINFVGLLQVTNAFLPLLRRHPQSSLINVSSGLAFSPLAHAPIYCATKAAVHSFSLSLRHQLRATGVRVIELLPPLVYDTELHEGQPPIAPEMMARGMNVEAFTRETFAALDAGETEIVPGPAHMLQQRINEVVTPAFAMMNGA